MWNGPVVDDSCVIQDPSAPKLDDWCIMRKTKHTPQPTDARRQLVMYSRERSRVVVAPCTTCTTETKVGQNTSDEAFT